MACQYGDKQFGRSKLSAFWKPRGNHLAAGASSRAFVVKDAVPAWDVPIEMARRAVETKATNRNLAALKREEQFREHVDEMADRIIAAMGVSRHLGLPPCTTCTKACPCMSYCSGSQAHCAMECCNQEGCYVDPPANGYNPLSHDWCTEHVSGAFVEKCGNGHPYLRSVDAKIRRACRGVNPNIQAALAAIDIECKA